MSELANALDVLEQQRQSYRALHRVSLRQRECIECEDMEGLSRAFDEIHRMMERILLQQARMPDVSGFDSVDRREVGAAQGKLRVVIGEIERLRRDNVDSIKGLMQRVRGELRQFGRGRRAARGYGKSAVGEARFFDGTR